MEKDIVVLKVLTTHQDVGRPYDVNRLHEGVPALFLAIINVFPDGVAHLLNVGANPNKVIGTAGTALHLMAKQIEGPLKDRVAVFKALVKAPNIVLDAPDQSGFSPLVLAIANRNIPAISCLLEAGANPNLQNNTDFMPGSTPLMLAAEKGYSEIVALLLKYRADLELKDSKDMTALYVAIHAAANASDKSPYEATVASLLRAGARIDHTIGRKVSCLVLAQRSGSKKILAQMQAITDSKDMPLHHAISRGNLESLKVLLSGPDVEIHAKNKSTSKPLTPLDLAKTLGHNQMIPLLNEVLDRQSYSALVKGKEDAAFKGTLLHYAVYRNDIPAAQRLLDQPTAVIDVNDKSGKDDCTALHIAVEKENKEAVTLLLKHQADIHIPNAKGKTPLTLAEGKDNPVLLRLLLEPEVGLSANASPLNLLRWTIIKGYFHSFIALCNNHFPRGKPIPSTPDTVALLQCAVEQAQSEIAAVLVQKIHYSEEEKHSAGLDGIIRDSQKEQVLKAAELEARRQQQEAERIAQEAAAVAQRLRVEQIAAQIEAQNREAAQKKQAEKAKKAEQRAQHQSQNPEQHNVEKEIAANPAAAMEQIPVMPLIPTPPPAEAVHVPEVPELENKERSTTSDPTLLLAPLHVYRKEEKDLFEEEPLYAGVQKKKKESENKGPQASSSSSSSKNLSQKAERAFLNVMREALLDMQSIQRNSTEAGAERGVLATQAQFGLMRFYGALSLCTGPRSQVRLRNTETCTTANAIRNAIRHASTICTLLDPSQVIEASNLTYTAFAGLLVKKNEHVQDFLAIEEYRIPSQLCTRLNTATQSVSAEAYMEEQLENLEIAYREMSKKEIGVSFLMNNAQLQPLMMVVSHLRNMMPAEMTKSAEAEFEALLARKAGLSFDEAKQARGWIVALSQQIGHRFLENENGAVEDIVSTQSLEQLVKTLTRSRLGRATSSSPSRQPTHTRGEQGVSQSR
eukprot:Pompholyxophrys_punicea_v1_NODE_32_length_5086_cov_32.566090.p1 type:complete len:967 gc:universal NODE_32_length_5086_cov_32.566090:4867-1967(-)